MGGFCIADCNEDEALYIRVLNVHARCIVCVACRGGRGNKGAHGRVVPQLDHAEVSRRSTSEIYASDRLHFKFVSTTALARVTRGRAASPPPLAEASARAFSSTSAETPRSVAQLQPVVIVRRTAAGAAMMTGKGLISISRASQSTKRTRSPYKGTARWRLLRESAPCDAAPARRLRGLPRRLKGARERPPGPIDRSIRKRG